MIPLEIIWFNLTDVPNLWEKRSHRKWCDRTAEGFTVPEYNNNPTTSCRDNKRQLGEISLLTIPHPLCCPHRTLWHCCLLFILCGIVWNLFLTSRQSHIFLHFSVYIVFNLARLQESILQIHPSPSVAAQIQEVQIGIYQHNMDVF